MVASLPCFCDLSLNCVIRDACPKPVKQPSTQASSAWAGTWLCTKIVLRAGSMPSARYCAAVTSVRRRSVLGILRNGDGVQVDDAEERVVVVLQPDPLLDRAQRVAEVQGVRGGLHAGEHDPLLCVAHDAVHLFMRVQAYSTVTGAWSDQRRA